MHLHDLNFLQGLAARARAIALAYFRSDLEVITKSDESPVTRADREIELALREMIAEHYPNDTVRGEEFDVTQGSSGFSWVIDPIDGTKSFVAGLPLFGALVARLEGPRPIWGMMEMPALAETWIGDSNGMATLNGKPVRVRSGRGLHDAVLIAHLPQMLGHSDDAAALKLIKSAKIHRLGGDCYGFGMVASGHADICIQAGLAPHDYAALIPLIAGAGGIMTDWQGAPLDATKHNDVIAVGNAKLHQHVVDLLASGNTDA